MKTWLPFTSSPYCSAGAFVESAEPFPDGATLYALHADGCYTSGDEWAAMLTAQLAAKA